ESSRSKTVRSLERSVTAGKLKILRDSEPAIPLVPDFSQPEAPPDVQLLRVAALPPQEAVSPTTAAEEELTMMQIWSRNPLIIIILIVLKLLNKCT
ncbi:hypothetical protein ABG768_021944, partial [Culter alburnus]